MTFPPMQTLKTDRLVLRKLEERDTPLYFQRLGSSQEVTRHMLWVPHREIAESAASIQKVLRRYEEGASYRWAIALKRDDSLIGIIDLLHFDETANTCSFAYMLGKEFWNQGYGTEAVEAAFRFAFTQMEVEAIIADHFAENPASGAVMRKAGMAYVRTLPEKYEKLGVRHDAVEYCITKEQWNKKHSTE